MREQIEFRGPVPAEVRTVMCEWLLHHGIPPDDVIECWRSEPAWIERDPGLRRIAYLSMELSVDWLPGGGFVLRGAPVTRTVQLEAAPSPFPPLTGCHIRVLQEC